MAGSARNGRKHAVAKRVGFCGNEENTRINGELKRNLDARWKRKKLIYVSEFSGESRLD